MVHDKLLVSFNDLCLANFIEWNYSHTIIWKDEVKDVINNSKKLIWVSEDDLFAPYNKKEYEKTEKIINILNKDYWINISFDNFIETDEDSKFINPINIFSINKEIPLIVIEYNFTLKKRNKEKDLNIDDMFSLNKEFKFHIFKQID